MPPERAAHVWETPATTATTPVRPGTGTAVALLVVFPVPSCPSVLLPQQDTLPPERSAQAWA